MYVDNNQAEKVHQPSGGKGSKQKAEGGERLRTKEWLEKMNEIMDFRGFKVDNAETFEKGESSEEEGKLPEEEEGKLPEEEEQKQSQSQNKKSL